MCGICGLATASATTERLTETVVPMVDSLTHRGPDGKGIHSGPGWVLGHTRLAVIDMHSGDQPMTDGQGHWIVYNGEVYNYRSLRTELERAGYTFSTNSDTEVVLRAWAHWGLGALSRLEGMFAFAIADDASGEVVLARDRVGIKPLYYSLAGSDLVFGSEIKSLLANPLVDRQVCLAGLDHFLSFGFFPRDQPPFANILTLPPGSAATWRSGRLTLETYWDPRSVLDEHTPVRMDRSARDHLRSLIADAAQSQLVADVPLGVFLSGGLDSGIVAASLGESGQAPPAFTVAFPTPEGHEEVHRARLLAARYGLGHTVIDVGPDELADRVVSLLDHFDEPFADTSAIPTFLVAQAARSEVTVILSGDGGDELWGGYGAYRRYRQLSIFQRVTGSAPGAGGTLRRFLQSGAQRVPARRAARLAELADLLDRGPIDTYLGLQAHRAARGLIRASGTAETVDAPGRWPDGGGAGDWPGGGRAEALDWIMCHDLAHSLADDMLKKVDMMSMAVGLEVRVPLLDRRLVELALATSWRDKVGLRTTKRPMRELGRSLLPTEMVTAGKQGFSFGSALDDALRGPLRDTLDEAVLGGMAIRDGILDRSTAEQVRSEHLDGASHGKVLIALVAFERWASRWL